MRCAEACSAQAAPLRAALCRAVLPVQVELMLNGRYEHALDAPHGSNEWVRNALKELEAIETAVGGGAVRRVRKGERLCADAARAAKASHPLYVPTHAAPATAPCHIRVRGCESHSGLVCCAVLCA